MKHPVHHHHRAYFRATGIPLAWRFRHMRSEQEADEQALRPFREDYELKTKPVGLQYLIMRAKQVETRSKAYNFRPRTEYVLGLWRCARWLTNKLTRLRNIVLAISWRLRWPAWRASCDNSFPCRKDAIYRSGPAGIDGRSVQLSDIALRPISESKDRTSGVRGDSNCRVWLV